MQNEQTEHLREMIDSVVEQHENYKERLAAHCQFYDSNPPSELALENIQDLDKVRLSLRQSIERLRGALAVLGLEWLTGLRDIETDICDLKFAEATSHAVRAV
jgi:hypothetical protein